MYSIKSNESNSIISIDYDSFTNTVEIHIGNSSGFRFVHLDREKCDMIKDIIDELKNEIV